MRRAATSPEAPGSPGAPAGAPSARARPAADRAPMPVAITAEDGAVLLALARAIVVAAASGRVRSFDGHGLLPSAPSGVLRTPAAVFVTLRNGPELRGCMGSLDTTEPLWRNLVSAAVGAAASDPRFLPVGEAEVPSLSIDVSVLGPAVPLGEVSAFRPGDDGVIVELGGRRGLLLPEVATDRGWGLRQMAEAACRKVGLPADGWHAPAARVLVFRTTRFGEAGGPAVDDGR